MNGKLAQINLILAWLWMLLGFASGLYLGSHFHHENWLGGYASLKRRLYRLCHISFFGLGAVNLMFCLTAHNFTDAGLAATTASWGFLVGAVTMPACCLLMARWPGLRLLFAVPVLSLLLAGALTLWELIRL